MAQIKGIEDSRIHAVFSTPAPVDTPADNIARYYRDGKGGSTAAGDGARLKAGPISTLLGGTSSIPEVYRTTFLPFREPLLAKNEENHKKRGYRFDR